MEDNKSKAVIIAEYQRDMILNDINTSLEGYVSSVKLDTSPRDIIFRFEAKDCGSLDGSTPPVAYHGRNVVSL